MYCLYRVLSPKLQISLLLVVSLLVGARLVESADQVVQPQGQESKVNTDTTITSGGVVQQDQICDSYAVSETEESCTEESRDEEVYVTVHHKPPVKSAPGQFYFMADSDRMSSALN